MIKYKAIFAYAFLLLTACKNSTQTCEPGSQTLPIDSLAKSLNWPEELMVTGFAGPKLVPSPACLAVAATGEVYVGVDMIGSLGKKPGKGMIVRLLDCNNDGITDSHTEYAAVDNPRGMLPIGDKLYVLHTVFTDTLATGMDLVVFEDKNQDGVADGPSRPLIEHISNPVYLQSRGTDHATNGIRMGIDGWIYIAVGDFGFHEAVDRDGKKLTMHGGGIVRVRPDGTEMEIFSHGTRNIYDVAIDPYMNIFTRDNTNDGGGWNIRFSHHIQSGEYGYPVLFKHFTEEIIPAMIDLGGGSGTGSLFMDDPLWPEKFNHVPMMADWGRSEVYIHRVTPSLGSFTQKEENFFKLPQVTDLDIDGSGRLYLSAWDGAGYSGDSGKGFVVRAVPKNWQYQQFPDLKSSSIEELTSLLKSGGAVARLSAQQELLTRPAKDVATAAWNLATDKGIPLFARVAAIYTYAQVTGKEGIKNLVELSADEPVKEFALRALADRKPFSAGVPIEPFMRGLKDTVSSRVQVASIIGLGRLGRIEAAKELLKVHVPASFVAPSRGTEGPHATPNTEIIAAHLAVKALVQLNAVDECVAAISSPNSTLALWALRYMYDQKAVEGLMAAYNQSPDKELKIKILATLGRLYNMETPYDGSTWWSTRPDGHGPFYKPTTWAASGMIKSFLEEEWNKSNTAGKQLFADLNGKLRMGITQFGGEDKEKNPAEDEAKVDFEKIKSKKGQIGQSSIEDIMLAMDKIKGDPAIGKNLFVQQGCIACHSTKKEETLKGPFMGQIGSIMNRKQIAESILKPNASISQGFATVVITTKDAKTVTGFVSDESAGRIMLRDIAGKVHTINTKDIQARKELPASMMPVGLANALSYEEFGSLITWLSQQKK
jgi:putative heme-binding domain-containing protein